MTEIDFEKNKHGLSMPKSDLRKNTHGEARISLIRLNVSLKYTQLTLVSYKISPMCKFLIKLHDLVLVSILKHEIYQIFLINVKIDDFFFFKN